MKYKGQYFNIDDSIVATGKNKRKSAARKAIASLRRTRNFRAFRKYDNPQVPGFRAK